MNTTLELLNKIDEKVDLSNHTERCVSFMIEVCKTFKDRLSDSGRSALAVAERYWTKLATEAELNAARVAYWQETEASSWSVNTDTPEACAARAVICLLYPRWFEDDAFEHMAWFVQMSTMATGDAVEQQSILRGFFLNELQDCNQ